MSAKRTLNGLKTNWNGSPRLALACALLAVFAAAPLRAQSYQDLYDFGCAAGCTPYGKLTQGKNGNLYGTSSSGGANNLGTIFMVSLTGAYTDLFDFTATTGAGGGGLTLESIDKNFYGTTTGTLFQFNPLNNAFAVMYTFGTDANTPGPPVEGKDSNLYGVVGETPYRFTVTTATLELLSSSVSGDPSGPLFAASDGYMYGATFNGGHPEAGDLFRLSTTGAIKKLYTYQDNGDGAFPNAPITQGIKDGNLYGTTHAGGFYTDAGDGTIFEVSLPSDNFGDPYSFGGSAGAGTNPTTGLLSASDGNFYGTTNAGGSNDLGVIFEWQTGGSYFELFDFSGNVGPVPGASPNTAIMEDTNGMFYGLTSSGGANGVGVFYTMTPAHPVNHISLCCNWFVVLDQPVTVVGQNLTGVINVYFGSVPAQFRLGSGTFLIADVPSAAIDGLVTVTLATGQQIESQQSVHVLPKITNLDPSSGPVGTQVGIVGGGFAGTTKVTFGGVATGNFTVVTPALIQATVPEGATTGKVGVVTPNGSAKSKETFTVN
jgi:uncharacterized repeat protein (TIGR03803 family)